MLRAYLKATYQEIVDVLDASDKLQKCLHLKQLPHYSTLKRFADRSDTIEIADAMLVDIVREIAGDDDEVAIDSIGVETTPTNAYFKTRSGTKRKTYVKLSVGVPCGSMMPTSVVAC